MTSVTTAGISVGVYWAKDVVIAKRIKMVIPENLIVFKC